jgi:hypothetical protein
LVVRVSHFRLFSPHSHLIHVLQARPDEIKLNSQERDELIKRVESNQLSPSDHQLLVKLIQCFFWITFMLRESKISLRRLKTASAIPAEAIYRGISNG